VIEQAAQLPSSLTSLSPHPAKERREAKRQKAMFETITSTAASALSFANITSTLATATAAIVLEHNATELRNFSGSSASEDLIYPPCHRNDPEFNCSVEEYLNAAMGLKRMPLETAIWVSC
jgi:hypothetical protein